MQIIISHVNTDFDALASMCAARKLYPDATVVISNKQNNQVKQFLTIYRDTIDIVEDNKIEGSEVTEVILVDVASVTRIGPLANQLQMDKVRFIVYDHHPRTNHNVESDFEIIDQVGATVTILIEEIRKRDLSLSSFEATLFGLGIYTDTGSFTYKNTTERDFEAARFLMEQGMNLEMIARFSDYSLLPEQQTLLNQLFSNVKISEMDGLELAIASYETDNFLPGLAAVTEKLLDLLAADAVLTIVKMKKHTYIVGRGSAERINLLPLLKKFGGGGHDQAGSATIKRGDFSAIVQDVCDNLPLILKPATTARELMASPVKTVPPETKIEEAGQIMYRYEHSGYPVVENNQLQGIITRRDLDKANHHGLGHAPVKAYMSTDVVTITPETTIEEIQKLIIEHNVGRLPVIEQGIIIGIVTRTDVIKMLHKQQEAGDGQEKNKEYLQTEMQAQLPHETYQLLKNISHTASKQGVPVYLIGGIVRDLFLNEPNDDVDIVVEGDGIAFARQLRTDYGGEVIVHETFGTATWEHPDEISIDVTSARLEYYDRPASLPDVEFSTLQKDLFRRDFTFNAMAIQLNEDVFGKLIDPFYGQEDLQKKHVRILHNLSFIEDPTRILRAVRFETRFNFSMDGQTEKLALHSIDRVKNLSAKRIANEMKRLFTEKNQAKTMERLFKLQFWQQFAVDSKALKESSTHAKQLENLYYEKTTEKWFHFFLIPFYNSGEINAAAPFALKKEQMKFLQDVKALRKNTAWQQIEKKGDFQRELKHCGEEAILFLVAKHSLTNESALLNYLEKRKNIPHFLTGEDLIKAGMKPSKVFSKVLLESEVAILNEEITSRDEAIQWLEKAKEEMQ